MADVAAQYVYFRLQTEDGKTLRHYDLRCTAYIDPPASHENADDPETFFRLPVDHKGDLCTADSSFEWGSFLAGRPADDQLLVDAWEVRERLRRQRIRLPGTEKPYRVYLDSLEVADFEAYSEAVSQEEDAFIDLCRELKVRAESRITAAEEGLQSASEELENQERALKTKQRRRIDAWREFQRKTAESRAQRNVLNALARKILELKAIGYDYEIDGRFLRGHEVEVRPGVFTGWRSGSSSFTWPLSRSEEPVPSRFEEEGGTWLVADPEGELTHTRLEDFGRGQMKRRVYWLAGGVEGSPGVNRNRWMDLNPQLDAHREFATQRGSDYSFLVSRADELGGNNEFVFEPGMVCTIQLGSKSGQKTSQVWFKGGVYNPATTRYHHHQEIVAEEQVRSREAQRLRTLRKEVGGLRKSFSQRSRELMEQRGALSRAGQRKRAAERELQAAQTARKALDTSLLRDQKQRENHERVRELLHYGDAVKPLEFTISSYRPALVEVPLRERVELAVRFQRPIDLCGYTVALYTVREGATEPLSSQTIGRQHYAPGGGFRVSFVPAAFEQVYRIEVTSPAGELYSAETCTFPSREQLEPSSFLTFCGDHARRHWIFECPCDPISLAEVFLNQMGPDYSKLQQLIAVETSCQMNLRVDIDPSTFSLVGSRIVGSLASLVTGVTTAPAQQTAHGLLTAQRRIATAALESASQGDEKNFAKARELLKSFASTDASPSLPLEFMFETPQNAIEVVGSLRKMYGASQSAIEATRYLDGGFVHYETLPASGLGKLVDIICTLLPVVELIHSKWNSANWQQRLTASLAGSPTPLGGLAQLESELARRMSDYHDMQATIRGLEAVAIVLSTMFPPFGLAWALLLEAEVLHDMVVPTRTFREKLYWWFAEAINLREIVRLSSGLSSGWFDYELDASKLGDQPDLARELQFRLRAQLLYRLYQEVATLDPDMETVRQLIAWILDGGRVPMRAVMPAGTSLLMSIYDMAQLDNLAITSVCDPLAGFETAGKAYDVWRVSAMQLPAAFSGDLPIREIGVGDEEARADRDKGIEAFAEMFANADHVIDAPSASDLSCEVYWAADAAWVERGELRSLEEMRKDPAFKRFDAARPFIFGVSGKRAACEPIFLLAELKGWHVDGLQDSEQPVRFEWLVQTKTPSTEGWLPTLFDSLFPTMRTLRDMGRAVLRRDGDTLQIALFLGEVLPVLFPPAEENDATVRPPQFQLCFTFCISYLEHSGWAYELTSDESPVTVDLRATPIEAVIEHGLPVAEPAR